ncbi:MAG TPA: hypothetical protein VII70_01455 [Steroidobacteraceae bacterium]
MLELFCRAPDGIILVPGAHLTPIPVDEAVASLSAILLDKDYYDEFVISGRPARSRWPAMGRRGSAHSFEGGGVARHETAGGPR